MTTKKEPIEEIRINKIDNGYLLLARTDFRDLVYSYNEKEELLAELDGLLGRMGVPLPKPPIPKGEDVAL